MAHHDWHGLTNGGLGAVVATISGATIRGMIGPGPWQWKEWSLGCVVGLAFSLWVGPGLVDWLNLGERVYGGLCLGFGMTALPISRGIIRLARIWSQHSEDFINKHGDDK